jgi:hypothetical protein
MTNWIDFALGVALGYLIGIRINHWATSFFLIIVVVIWLFRTNRNNRVW